MAPFPSIPLPRGWPRFVKQGLLTAVGLERLALAEARSGFEHSRDPRSRMAADVDRWREHCELQAEELRILRARMEHVPPERRPHYPPEERLAILMFRAKAGLNAAETARRFVVTPTTVGSWMRRLDEEGEEALVKTPVPVNRYDDAVRLLAHELYQAAPGFGRRKLAGMLGRAGLHLAASTLRRMQERPPPAPPPPKPRSEPEHDAARKRVVTAKRVHHVWHLDVTAIAIGAPGFGFWAPWWPFALLLRWMLSWHIALVVDHFSRSLVAFGVFRHDPNAAQMCALLDRAVEKSGGAPRYIISDQGPQFRDKYRDWCGRNGVRPRFGAVGKHGSVAVVERFILSLKREFLWKIFVPYSLERMEQILASYQRWFNERRPHEFLGGRTPAEVRDGITPARERVRFEPRARMPLARGHPRVKRCRKLKLRVSYVDGHKELPVVALHAA